MKSVQAIYIASNSSNEKPRHHLCREGPESWCKWQRTKAAGKKYDHKDPLPDAIVELLRPIYACLGCRSLLENVYWDIHRMLMNNFILWYGSFPKGTVLGQNGNADCLLSCRVLFQRWSQFSCNTQESFTIRANTSLEGSFEEKGQKETSRKPVQSFRGSKKLPRRARRKRKGLDDVCASFLTNH